MGRHASPDKIYRPLHTGKHAAVPTALDAPHGLAVTSPKTAGIRRLPLAVAMLASVGGAATTIAPAVATDSGSIHTATVGLDTFGRAEVIAASPEVQLQEVEVEVKTEAPAPEPIELEPAVVEVVPAAVEAPAPPAPVAAPVNEVTVQPGDTVGAIAARHGVDMNAMLAANGLSAWTTIFAGQTLVLTGPAKPVPAAPAPAAAAPAPAPAPAPAATGRGQAIANAALAQVGMSQDCVYMVGRALSQVLGGSIDSWRKWPVEYYQFGYAVAEPQVGDLIYYVNGGGGLAHIAIYIGNGQAVHGGWDGWTTKVFSVNVGSGPQYIRLR